LPSASKSHHLLEMRFFRTRRNSHPANFTVNVSFAFLRK
jgi:hypothetical protein